MCAVGIEFNCFALYSIPDLNLGPDPILQWKKSMELGRRHFYMEYVYTC